MTKRLCEWVFQMGEAWPDDVVNMVLLDGDNEVVTMELRMSTVLALLRRNEGFRYHMLYKICEEIGDVDEETIFSSREVEVEL